MRARRSDREAERLAALRDLEILDTPRERRFDEIVELAARICDVPVCLVSLVEEERQWFKAEVGLGLAETSFDRSICAHAILQPGLTVIPDTLADPRTADNPLCIGDPSFRFYAGALLSIEDGPPLGTLCVLDYEPRDLDQTQRYALEVLARQVATHLHLRRSVEDERQARALADGKIAELEEAVKVQEILRAEVDHRVKNSLHMVGSLLNLQSNAAASPELAEHLRVARDRVRAIATLHEQLHGAARLDQVDVGDFLSRLAGTLRSTAPGTVAIDVEAEPLTLDSRRAGAVGIVVNELVTNAIKHAFPDSAEGRIAIRYGREGDRVLLEVADTGIGLAREGDEAGSGGRRPGLGQRLVEAGAAQLGGDVVYEAAGPGTRCRILIPLPA